MRHPWLRALGRDDMPTLVALEDGRYEHLRTYKHDFFAATGLYRGPSGKVILKIGRTARLFGLPMTWLGRHLARREQEVYRFVEDLPGVPRCMGWPSTKTCANPVSDHNSMQRGTPGRSSTNRYTSCSRRAR
jgi:hypothetical protein